MAYNRHSPNQILQVKIFHFHEQKCKFEFYFSLTSAAVIGAQVHQASSIDVRVFTVKKVTSNDIDALLTEQKITNG